MKTKIYFILTLMLISVIGLNAQQLTQNFTFSASDVQTDSIDTFDIVKLKTCGILQGDEYLGQPQLPLKNFRLLLPQNACAINVNITVNSEQLLSGNYNIFPVQHPQVDTLIMPFVEPDTAIYNSNDPYPANNIISWKTLGLRDYNILAVSFIPFRYTPLSKQLYLFTDITITVEYTVNSQTQIFCYRDYDNTDDLVYETVKKDVLNPEQINTFYPDVYSKIENYRTSDGSENNNIAFSPTELPCLHGSAVDYVIITNNTDTDGNSVGDFTTAFQELADWKTFTGTPAVVITVNQIEEHYSGVDTQEKIREFIKDARKRWGTDYILLGGDTRIVPIRTMHSLIHPNPHGGGSKPVPSDLYYSDIWHPSYGYNYNWNENNNSRFGEAGTDRDNCDFIADIALGRAPVYNTGELETFLQKNYTHYRCSLADDIPLFGTHLGRHLNISTASHTKHRNGTPVKWGEYIMGLYTTYLIAEDFREIPDIMYTLSEEIPEDELNPSWSWPGGNVYDYTDEFATVKSTTDELNKNNSIILHLGHANNRGLRFSKSSVLNYMFTIDQLKGLDAVYNGILATCGCITNPIDFGDYFGKRWITEQKGGVAYIGSIRSTYSYSKISWYTFFNQLYTNNNYNNYKLGYTKLLNWCDSLDLSWNQYVNATYHLLGDPELPIYTHTPENIVLQNYPAVIHTGDPHIYVEIQGIPEGEEATICFYKENDVYRYYHQVSNGMTGYGIIYPDTPGELHMTITGHNINPEEKIINVVPNTGVHLYISNYTIIDEDGDGFIEAGETVEISIELSNSGLANASGINATLNTYDSHITILNDYSTFNNINSGQSANSFMRYSFIADNNIPSGKPFDFLLNISANNGFSYSDRINLHIITADLQQANRKAYVNSIERTQFFPGDIVSLHLQFQNAADAPVSNLTGTLTSTSEHVNISNNTQNFSASRPDIYGNWFPFTVEISETYSGQDLSFDITLTDEFGNTYDYNNFDLNESIPQITNFNFNAGLTSIDLRWNQADEDFATYNIYRSNTQSGIYTKINTEQLKGTAYFSDIDLITKHIYWYKISPVSQSGDELPLNMISSHKAWTSLPCADNFPLLIPLELSSQLFASPTLYNIDEDDELEILISCQSTDWQGGLLAFNHDGTELFDYNPDEMSYFSGETRPRPFSSPCVADIDNDASLDVIGKGSVILGYKTFDGPDNGNIPDLLWQVEGDEYINTGFWGSYTELTVSDLNGDGFTEMIAPYKPDSVVGIAVYKQLGESYDTLWYDTIFDEYDKFNYDYDKIHHFATADLNGNGEKEIIVTAYKQYSWNRIYIFKANGDPFYNTLYSQMPSNSNLLYPIVADIDKDGIYEIVTTHYSDGIYYLRIFQPEEEWLYEDYELSGVSSINNFIIGDLNNDNELEVIITNNNKTIYIADKNGIIQTTFNTDYKILTGPMLADIDEDDDIEIIITEDRYLGAYNPDGSRVEYWQQDLGYKFEGYSQPAIADIDNNGKNEVVMISGRNSLVHVFETDGDAGKIECGLTRYDEKNSGVYPFNECMFSASGSITIDQSEPVVWDTEKEIKGNITIMSGSELTVTSKISMAIESKIIIEPGAKLIIDGGTLTNKCGKLWKGITVLGNPDLPQWNESNQGVLVIINNSIIEHAEIAVTVGSPFSGPNNGINGGIVKLDNVTFRDNETAIKFYEYQNFAFNNPEFVTPNVSYIYNCTFETTDYLVGLNKAPKEFIYLWGVDGVSTYQSSFTNFVHEAYPYDLKGKGVKLISANSSVTNSIFDNLSYGIFIQGTSDYSVLKIRENNFTDNITGIYAEAAGDFTVYDNDFTINKVAQSVYIQGVEAYYNTETFTIEENRFTGDNSGSVIGIKAVYNNSDQNLYKNSFSNLSKGVYVYQNPSLQIECNEFSDCFEGVFMDEDGAFWAQGTIDYPAGNKFNNYFTYHLYAQNDFYSYYYDPDNPYYPSPYLVTGNINLESILSGTNECLSHFSGGGGGGGSIEDLAEKDEEINENEIILASITDGGDTEGTNQDVDNSNPNEALKLRNKLLEKSPNLSDTVMINATMTEDVLPSIMLTHVLSENPQAAKSGDIKDALDNRVNQLPYYMRNAIDQGRFSTSLKEDIESEIAQLRKERARIYSALLAKYSSDTTQTSQDSLLLLMQNETDLRGQYRLMSYYMSKKDRVNAENIFNSIPANFELSAKEENEYNAMTELNNVLFNLIDEEKSLFGVDSTQREIINTLSEDTVTYAGAYARGIMTLIDTVDHISVFPFPEENTGDKGADPIVYPENFEVYPNPASDYFIIDYALNEKDNINDVRIDLCNYKGDIITDFDINHRIYQILVECEYLDEGVYWCRKLINEKVTDVEKVIIDRGNIARDIHNDKMSYYEAVKLNNEQILTDRLKVYPNPAKNYFIVSYNFTNIETNDNNIIITDNEGRIIKEIKLDKSSNKQTISSSDWAKGVYTISLLSDNKIIETIKLVLK